MVEKSIERIVNAGEREADCSATHTCSHLGPPDLLLGGVRNAVFPAIRTTGPKEAKYIVGVRNCAKSLQLFLPVFRLKQ